VISFMFSAGDFIKLLIDLGKVLPDSRGPINELRSVVQPFASLTEALREANSAYCNWETIALPSQKCGTLSILSVQYILWPRLKSVVR
jgi:hypothetical protein